MDPHRAHLSREFYGRAESRAILVDAIAEEAQWHIGHVEVAGKYLRTMAYKTVDDFEANGFHNFLDDMADAQNSLV